MASGTILIDEDRCKGCGLCVSVCPRDVIVMDAATLNTKGYHPAALIDPEEQCTGCGVCAIMCPDACITVYRETHRQPRHQAVPA